MHKASHYPVHAGTAGEKCGKLVGYALGWLTYCVSYLRSARTFHPVGLLFKADVTTAVVPGSLPEVDVRDTAESQDFLRHLATRLAGPALLRFSTALWKDENERLDVLGCAVRFSVDHSFGPLPRSGDQDLLFATVSHPLLTLLAPFVTDPHDFRTNTFYAVSPFSVEHERSVIGLCTSVLFRLRFLKPDLPMTEGSEEGASESRSDKLRSSVRKHQALMEISIRFTHGTGVWHPLVRISIRTKLEKGRDIDDAALRFSPFQVGKGIHPRGFVHYLRVGAYSLSQSGRASRRE